MACIHTDILSTYFRVELKIGMKEQQQAALRRQNRLKNQSLNREQLSNIFGVCTMSEARKTKEKIAEAGRTAENPTVKHYRECIFRCAHLVS